MMPEETRALFKVMRRSPRGFLYSAIIRHKRARIRYSEDGVNHSPDGRRPFAFETEEQARRFEQGFRLQMMRADLNPDPVVPPSKRRPYQTEVWEVEATGVKEIETVACDWDCFEIIKEFWRRRHSVPRVGGWAYTIWEGSAPPGTVSCETIKLVRKVV